jgi:hypothetical protein
MSLQAMLVVEGTLANRARRRRGTSTLSCESPGLARASRL